MVPDDVSSETFDPTAHTGWDDPLDVSIAQGVGKAWITQRRSALLIVPSVITGGRDTNVVVKPEHPDAARIAVGPEQHVHLDPRFFR